MDRWMQVLAVFSVTIIVLVLSSVRRMIAVVDRDGRLVAAETFPARLLPQPEGLAFAPDGTLYVASEGAGGRATIARYSPAAD